MEQDKKLYNILGVSPNATESEIKKAYHRLALKHHPDKGGSHERFKEISSAFAILGDAEKRKQYDSGRLDSNGQEQHRGFPGAGMDGFDPFDLFSSFFGGQGRRVPRRPQKQRKSVPIHVSLEDLYSGKESTLRITRQGLCVECNGRGGIGPQSQCSACAGVGKVRKVAQAGPGMVQQIVTACDKCNAKGVTFTSKCTMCAGNRRCEESSEVTISIEKGTQDKDSIVLDGLGDWNVGVNDYDDIVLVVQTKRHNRLMRVGNDLHLVQHISLLDALTGCTFNYRHLDGKDYTIVPNCVIDPEFKYVVRNLGMPSKRSKVFGNLVISFKIAYPRKVVPNSGELSKLIGQDQKDSVMFSCVALERAS